MFLNDNSDIRRTITFLRPRSLYCSHPVANYNHVLEQNYLTSIVHTLTIIHRKPTYTLKASLCLTNSCLL